MLDFLNAAIHATGGGSEILWELSNIRVLEELILASSKWTDLLELEELIDSENL